jgi:hypothetical protein
MAGASSRNEADDPQELSFRGLAAPGLDCPAGLSTRPHEDLVAVSIAMLPDQLLVTNTHGVSESSVVASSSRSERTRVRLLEAGVELFERSGYDQTTVAQIATASGVTEMTFFRHYATKAHLLLDDPYDPVIVEAVAAQPRGLPVLIRVTRGLAEASRNLPEGEMSSMRRRLRLAASTPSLDAAVRANTSR